MICPTCKVEMVAYEDADAWWWKCPVCGVIEGKVKGD